MRHLTNDDQAFSELEPLKFLFEGGSRSVFLSFDFAKAWVFEKDSVGASEYRGQKMVCNMVRTSVTSLLEFSPLKSRLPPTRPSQGFLAEDTKLEHGLFYMKDGEAGGLSAFCEMLGVAR